MTKRSRWKDLPTEAFHPESKGLDQRPVESILEWMSAEDHRVVEAVRAEAPRIARAAAKMARVLSSGGRVYYVGAGTSGRLGVLEAAECPPTFGTDPERIVALMAGGPDAVFRSREGAEDRLTEGPRLLRARGLASRDLVVGISASSVTSFVRGALSFARDRGAATVLVTCGARVRGLADVTIVPRVGPEVLAGSTRMKAGTATKLVLNRMTLVSMIRLKKVLDGYMVELRPESAKLRDRAIRIVQRLGEVDRGRAARLLQEASNDVKTAVVMARRGVAGAEARRLLKKRKGDLRAVLDASS